MSKTKKDKIELEDCSIECNFSSRARVNKIIRVTPNKDKSCEISLDELISVIVECYNNKVAAPLIFESTIEKMIEVERELNFKPIRDIKAGEIIPLRFTQQVPVEYAYAELAVNKLKLAGKKYIELTQDEMTDYARRYPIKTDSSVQDQPTDNGDNS